MTETLDGPLGPVEGGMISSELHRDGSREGKIFAPGYGEFYTSGGGDVEALALAVPTDAASGPVPAALTTLSDGALSVFDAAGAGSWKSASATVSNMAAAWKAYPTADVPRLIEPLMEKALDALATAVDARGAPRARNAAIEEAGVAERRRTGIEPARELVAPSSVLKTAGPTRNPDASATEDNGAGSEARCTVAHVTEPAPRKQRHIALILAKDLAANLATAMLLVDADGDLVFFNEPAEAILGRPYAEAQMSRAELARTFKPVDEAGEPVPLEKLPLSQAVRSGTPTHGHLRIQAVDGHTRDLEVVGIPLFTQVDQPVGGLAMFWERAEGA